jgi:UDP-3-O-[3-hydroxymyristoyl] glucosamine N-acyltransferase
MKISLQDLANKIGAQLHLPKGCSPDGFVEGVAPIDRASALDLTFLVNPDYAKFAAETKAAAVIVGSIMDSCSRPQLVHNNPYWAFAIAFQMFVPSRKEMGKIDERAFVSSSAKIGSGVTIYPFAHVSEGAVIGDNSVLFPCVHIGRDVTVGVQTILRSNVVVEDGCIIGDRVLIHGNTTVGADGFGFAPGESGNAKIPQVGIVRIEDDVEIGAGCTVDRAAFGETVIGRGTKLDSSVHVGHGAKIGAHGILCAGAGVGGSAKLGERVVLAGSTSVSNNVTIADNTKIGALAGVTKSLRESGEYMGFPAVPANQWRREVAAVRRLKSLEERISNLEKTLRKS